MKRGGITVSKVTVTFSEDQVNWLNLTATARSASVSDVIRRLVDETRGAYLTPADARLANGVAKG